MDYTSLILSAILPWASLVGERNMDLSPTGTTASPQARKEVSKSGCRPERAFFRPEILIFSDFQRTQDNKAIWIREE
jgi:hypothetical protein